MKTTKINLNLKNLNVLWLIVPAFIIAVSSCNTSSNDKDKNSDLSAEVDDVKKELNEIIEAEKMGLKNEVDSVVADFNQQVKLIESKIEKSNKKMNAEKEETLNNLKAQRDSLSMKLDKVESQSERSWKAFKDEMEHDTKQFTESVKDFFRDNK